jgi:thiamine biosynthesis lipoprotein ApbE
VDISNLELTGDCRILRKNQHTRFGLGPAWSGAGYGLVSKSLIEHGISDVLLRVGQTYGVIGGNPAVNVVEINYPLEPGREDAITIPVGHVRLREGQYLSCLDDDEHYFFERGEQYHQVVDPIYGKPVRNVRMACIVSQESPLQASIFAYALMVMGPDRGIEFVNETDGVEGIIFDENYEIHVSSGLEDIFWR